MTAEPDLDNRQTETVSEPMGAWQALRNGAQATSPILLGVVPFGLMAGVAAVNVGLTPLQGQAMSIIMFAGAAQLASLDLIGQGAPAAIVILTALIVNLRFIMYSAAIAPHFRPASKLLKVPLAYILTDQGFAVALIRYQRPIGSWEKIWYYFGSSLLLWTTWQIFTAAGVLLGAQVPQSWSLDFAVPLTFLAILAPTAKDRASGAAALTAGLTAVIGTSLPYNLGLITASLIGIAAGVIVERKYS